MRVRYLIRFRRACSSSKRTYSWGILCSSERSRRNAFRGHWEYATTTSGVIIFVSSQPYADLLLSLDAEHEIDRMSQYHTMQNQGRAVFPTSPLPGQEESEE